MWISLYFQRMSSVSKSLYNIDTELLCEPTQKHYLLNC